MTTQELSNGLIYGDEWNKNTITYSFKDTRLDYELASDYEGSVDVSSALKTAAIKIFDYIGSIINLAFVYEPNDVGDIVISEKTMPDIYTLGYAYMPYTDRISPSGDIYISAVFSDTDFTYGGLGYSALIHEIGHALGLDHPFGDGTYLGVDVHDTVMSYNTYSGYDPFNYGYYYSTSTFTSYQSADIQALQQIYGAKVAIDDNVYDLNSLLYANKIYGYGGTIEDNIDTIYDYGGTDTITLQNINSYNPQYIDMNPGTQSIVVNNQVHHYLTLTDTAEIENLIGNTTDDTIIANKCNNTIDTLGGYDRVYENDLSHATRVDVFQNNIVVVGIDSGFDVLKNVEALYVDNTAIDLSSYQREVIPNADVTKMEIGRLYLAVLDRVPDIDGLNYWFSNMQNGQNINDIANSFVMSDEFSNTYGNIQGNEAFVQTLYNNVLFRNADTQGLSYWVNELQNGQSEADVVVSFSNSEEFIKLTGIYFQDDSIAVLLS